MMASCGAAAVPAPRPAAATARYCCVSCAAYAVLLCALYMCCRAAAAVHVCCAPCCCARVHCAAVLLCCVQHVQCSPSSTVYSRCIVLRLTLTFGNARTPKRYLGSLFWLIMSARVRCVLPVILITGSRARVDRCTCTWLCARALASMHSE